MSVSDQLFISGSWVDSSVRGTNDVGSVINSAVPSGTGELLTDTYTLTVSARSGTTGTVTVAASSPNNPYDGKVVTGVTFDDSTTNSDVIPGVTINFDNAAANGNSATVIVGDPLGSFDASGVGAGTPGTGVRHQVTNNGANDVSAAKARLLTQTVMYKKTGQALEYVSPFAEDAIEKVAGGGSSRVMPYALKITSIAGSGGSKTCTLQIDGVTVPADNIQDLSDGTLQDGTNLKAIGSSNPYLFVDGPLAGMEFAIDADCANNDIANVLVFPSRYVQIAEDTAGVEGVYGTGDANLTESGQTTGIITASGVAYYWVRTLVPPSANNESNPYPCNVALEVTEAQDAGWGV
jgi:hypothetical protein